MADGALDYQEGGAVDDVLDYVQAYGKKASDLFFVAFLLPSLIACWEVTELYRASGESKSRTLYLDSLRLDVMVHSSLALSFFILFSGIKLVQYEGRNGHFLHNFTLSVCIVFTFLVLGGILLMLYTLVGSFLSKQDVTVVSSSSTWLADIGNCVCCIVVVVIIRAKNRAFVKDTVENCSCLVWWSSLRRNSSACKDSVASRYERSSYGTMDDSNINVVAGLGSDPNCFDATDPVGISTSSGNKRGSGLEGSFHQFSKVDGSSRLSTGRRSLPRTSELSYMVGTKVLAKWEKAEEKGSSKLPWYPATIAYVYKDTEERLYDVVYYDGDVERMKAHDSVHEYDESADYKIHAKSKRLKMQMMLWLCILYSYCCLKFVAFCFNGVATICSISPSDYKYIRWFHKGMFCLTLPAIIASLYLWFTTVRNVRLILHKYTKGNNENDLKHAQLAVQTIECILKIPLQPKHSMNKPAEEIIA